MLYRVKSIQEKIVMFETLNIKPFSFFSRLKKNKANGKVTETKKTLLNPTDTQKEKFNPFKALFFSLKETALVIGDLFDYRDAERVNSGADTFRLPESFAKLMRVRDYDESNGLFYMDDGKTPVAMFEIRGLSTEGLSAERMKEWEELVFEILGVFPPVLSKDYPWTVQMFCKDEADLSGMYHEVKQSIKPSIRDTTLSKAFLKMFEEHCQYLTKPEGIFHDHSTQMSYGGKRRVTRLVFYRRHPQKDKASLTKETMRLVNKLETAIKGNLAYGMSCKKIDDYDYFLWLFNKFHLSKKGYDRPSSFLKKFPYVDDKSERVYGYDFTEEAIGDPVYSDVKGGHWKVGESYHQYISTLGLRRAPEVGSVSAERSISGVQQAWFDGMPRGSEFIMSFEVIDKFDVQQMMIKKQNMASKQTSADALKTMQEIEYFQMQIEEGNYLYPMQAGCFVSADSLELLEERADIVSSKLEALRFNVLREEYDVSRLDKWVRFLPANYQPSYDGNYNTAKLTTARHIARLSPIGYGRITGSPNPLIVNHNRNGEPMYLDVIKDRTQNMHKLVIGNTGSGKSIAAAKELFHLMAIHRPYLTIIEAGGSFKFLVDFMECLGCTVNRIIVKTSNRLPPVSLNPYSETKEFVQQLDKMDALDMQIDAELEQKRADHLDSIINDISLKVERSIDESNKALTENKHDVEKAKEYLDNPNKAKKEEETIQRDYLSDFLLASLIISGEGKDPDEVGFDMMYKHELLEVIIETARKVVNDPHNPNNNQLLPSDIRDGLKLRKESLMAKTHRLDEDRVVRLDRLQKGFDTFLKITINRAYFNHPSKELKQADITYFEMGLWKDDKDSNIAPRTLAFVTMMNRVMADCEAKRTSGRLHILAADECHIVTTKKATAASVTQASKMARKIGLGLWFYTQQSEDFKDNAAKMLSNFEVWHLLKMPNDEIDRIAKFTNLDARQKELIRSIRVEKGAYSESVIISPKYQFLSRCIPCREILYMAKNEPEEQAQRVEIMNFFHISEPVAAVLQAQVVKGNPIDIRLIYEMLSIDAPLPEMPEVDEEKYQQIRKDWC
jgi:conjugative transfer ATPase